MHRCPCGNITQGIKISQDQITAHPGFLGMAQAAIGSDDEIRFPDGFCQGIKPGSAKDHTGIHRCPLLSMFASFYHSFPENKSTPGKKSSPGGLLGFVERLPPAMRVSRKKFYLCIEKENLQ
jgi:hypothetical protein